KFKIMKSVSLCLVSLFLLFSCQSSGEHHSSGKTTHKDHSLSASSSVDSSKSHPWQVLFNGKNLDGWRGFQHKSTAAWDVEKGTLHCNGNIKAAPTDLITDSSYKNFVLSIRWKISPESNSGILFHVTEDQ